MVTRGFRSLMWFFVGVFIVAVPMLAFADSYPASGGTVAATATWSASYASYSSINKSTAAQACSSLCSQFGMSCTAAAESPGAYCMSGGSPYGTIGRTWVCASGTNNYNGTCTVPYSCPYGGTLSGTTCINATPCTAPLVRDATTGNCVAPPCTAGESTSVVALTGWSLTWNSNAAPYDVSVPSQACDPKGCMIGGLKSSDPGCYLRDPGTAGSAPYPMYCWYHGAATGASCAASDPKPGDPPPAKSCPSGYSPGTVNGRSGCYPASNTTTTTNKTTDPTTQATTETTRVCDSAGNCATTTKTCDAAGNNCTTTTTGPGPNPAGPTNGPGTNPNSSSGPGTQPGPGDPGTPGKNGLQENLCAQNPNADGCQGKGGNFGGTTPSSDDLYKKESRTFTDVFGDFQSKVQSSAVYSSVSGFFNVSASGSCPTWSMTVPYINASISIDQMCNGNLGGALAVAGYVVLIGFAWIAFRIAIL